MPSNLELASVIVIAANILFLMRPETWLPMPGTRRLRLVSIPVAALLTVCLPPYMANPSPLGSLAILLSAFSAVELLAIRIIGEPPPKPAKGNPKVAFSFYGSQPYEAKRNSFAICPAHCAILLSRTRTRLCWAVWRAP